MSSGVDGAQEVPAVIDSYAPDVGVEVVQAELVDAGAEPAGGSQLQLSSYLAGRGPADPEQQQVLRHLAERALKLYDNSKAAGTLAAYGSAWKQVLSWCTEFELTDGWWHPGPAEEGSLVGAMPVEVLAVYLAWLVDREYAHSTVTKHCDAVAHFHLDVGLVPPTLDPRIKRLRAGIKREVGIRTQGKAPLLLPDIALLHAAIDRTRWHALTKLRNKALLLLNYWGGARRSELAGRMLIDFRLERNGLIVSLSRSKTNQEGVREEIGVLRRNDTLCPVTALTDWLEAIGRLHLLQRRSEADNLSAATTPAFCSITATGILGEAALRDQEVNRLIKALAKMVYPREVSAGYGAHSLRAGLATALDEAGVDAFSIARMLRHDLGILGNTSRYTRGHVLTANPTGQLVLPQPAGQGPAPQGGAVDDQTPSSRQLAGAPDVRE